MGWWTEHVVPRLVERNDIEAVRALRERAVVGLAGDVVEIGFGSGFNVAHYPAQVRAVWAVEPSDVAWSRAQARIAAGRVEVHRAGRDAQALELPDARFDAALSSFTLCTVPDAAAALAEVARVLRPGGVLHFFEHGRAPDARVARWQDRLQPVYGPLAGGCRLDRSIADVVRRSELEVEELEECYLERPTPLTYISLGRARRTA